MSCRHRGDRINGCCHRCGEHVRAYKPRKPRVARITVEVYPDDAKFCVVKLTDETQLTLKVSVKGFVGKIVLPFAPVMGSGKPLLDLANELTEEIKR